MRDRLPRLTILRLMTLVAYLGVTLAVARVSPALGVVAGCTCGLALVRTFGAVDRVEAFGAETRLGWKASLFVTSTAVAFVLLAATALVFLFALAVSLAIASAVGGFSAVRTEPRWVGEALGSLAVLAAPFAATVWAACRLRSALWPCAPGEAPDQIRFLPDVGPAKPDGIRWGDGGGDDSGGA